MKRAFGLPIERTPRSSSTRMRAFALLIGSALLLFGAASSAGACSIAPFGLVRQRGTISFVGTATPDTIPVSRLTGRTYVDTLPFDREPFGQVVRVEKLGSTAVEMGIPSGTTSVLLVPWTYDTMCTTVRWNGSAKWQTPGASGLYGGSVRDQRYWTDGVPVIDVFAPYGQPYTGKRTRVSPMQTLATDTLLAPDEMLALQDKLLLVSASRFTDLELVPAARVMLAWARDNPVLAARQPARGLVNVARYTLTSAQVTALTSPLAGTWRFTLSAGTDSLTFYARTALHPTVALWQLRRSAERTRDTEGYTSANGYHLMARAWLPSSGDDRIAPANGPFTGGYFMVADSLVTERDSNTSGGIDLFRDLSRTARAAGSDSASVTRLLAMRGASSTASYVPGRFTIMADGTAHYEEIAEREGTVILRLHGERLNTISW